MPLTTPVQPFTLSYVKVEEGGTALLKCRAVFAYLSLTLNTELISDDDALVAQVPMGKGIYLTMPETATSEIPETIGQSSTILRHAAKLHPYSNLYGPGDNYTNAQVDQWLDFCRAELDVPFAALASATTPSSDLESAVKSDVSSALKTLDAHLKTWTYLACNHITVADIALACTLLSTDRVTSETPNLLRWHNTILNHPKLSPLMGSGSSSSSSSSAPSADAGLQMSGVAPPVKPKLYKRQRLRIKEVRVVSVWRDLRNRRSL